MGFCYDKNYKKSLILDRYLGKCPPKDDMKYRQLDEADKSMLRSIEETRKNFGRLITELLAIRQILDYLDAAELHCLAQNFLGIIASLQRQRDKLLVLKTTFLAVRPCEEELAEIERFLTAHSQNRINYIQEKVIPWNLEYSPIKEYLEIRQSKDFREELYEWFGDTETIFYTSRDNPKEIKKYAEHIAKTVSDAGRMDEYKPRVKEYATRRGEKETKAKNERESEKLAKERVLLMRGMDDFHRAFNNSVSMLVGDELIGIGSRTVVWKINEHGRSAVFVLCCYIYNGRCMYRYLGENNSIVKTFSSACAFKNIAAASEAKSRIEVQYPSWVFSIATLPE